MKPVILLKKKISLYNSLEKGAQTCIIIATDYTILNTVCAMLHHNTEKYYSSVSDRKY
ncbi:hypothetical protein V9J15_00130 [Candidatus Liberibacter africanus]